MVKTIRTATAQAWSAVATILRETFAREHDSGYIEDARIAARLERKRQHRARLDGLRNGRGWR